MASIAEFTLPAGEFPLGRVFEETPEATLELDRVVPSGDTVMPYFWVYVEEGDLRRVLAVFEDLPELRSIALIEDLGDKGLFRAEWKPEYMGIMRAVAVTDVTVLSATGSQTVWTFELRASTVEQLAAFQQYCADHDIDVSLTRLSRLSAATTEDAYDQYDLTPEQHEALVLAHAEGYYDAPSETDQSALAAQIGITRQALSARLRRGYRNLIGSTLVHDRTRGSRDE